jgi:hypothetical protein
MVVDGVSETSAAEELHGSETLTFDVDKVLQLAHTDALIDLASNSSAFTVSEAYKVILDFIASFTKKVTVRERQRSKDKELQELRTMLRRIWRL